MSEHAQTVPATWSGPFVGEVGRVQLIPGETKLEVPIGEARDSDHWQPDGPPPPDVLGADYDTSTAADIAAALAGADAETAQRILEQEQAGKDRKTITDAAAARLAEVGA